ncbi:MAG: ATP-binding cassette domain-containing protein [Nitriliruptorales bacterium]|nr:ATP-binding cassette domain-containing protein [Nitriliruptorales bacterium]
MRPVNDIAALAFDRVTFGFGRTAVLREVSLAIHPGEFYAIVGANGSGKTTLMKLGVGLLRPASGTVRLFGTAIHDFHEWHKLGYVPQRAAARLTLPVSVDEVVRSGLAGHLGLLRRPTAAHRDRIEHVVEIMGLTGIRSSPINRLSGGQQQRALIARALVTAPRLLVLDEPTTGVDADARKALREALEHLVEVEQVAVAYISHDPEGFNELAHHVVEVVDGRLVEALLTDQHHAAAVPEPES